VSERVDSFNRIEGVADEKAFAVPDLAR
jgi:hypothetical protein